MIYLGAPPFYAAMQAMRDNKGALEMERLGDPHPPPIPASRPPSDHERARAQHHWHVVKDRLLGPEGILHSHRKGDCRLQELYFIEKLSNKHLYPKYAGWFGFIYLTKEFRASRTAERSFDAWAGEKYNHLSVTYLDDAARQPYQVTVRNNRLVYTNGAPIPTGEVMFVLGKDEQLYVAKKRRGQFQHSSFFSGAPVLSAGMFNMGPGGMVLSMNNESGHYATTEAQLEPVRHKLQSAGVLT